MGLGLAAEDFWSVTLFEADVIMRGAIQRLTRQKRMDDGRAYSLAVLFSWAMNDPKKMPKFEQAFPDGKSKVAQDPDDLWAEMSAWAETAQKMEARPNG